MRVRHSSVRKKLQKLPSIKFLTNGLVTHPIFYPALCVDRQDFNLQNLLLNCLSERKILGLTLKSSLKQYYFSVQCCTFDRTEPIHNDYSTGPNLYEL